MGTSKLHRSQASGGNGWLTAETTFLRRRVVFPCLADCRFVRFFAVLSEFGLRETRRELPSSGPDPASAPCSLRSLAKSHAPSGLDEEQHNICPLARRTAT
jgi:hypothetical protein